VDSRRWIVLLAGFVAMIAGCAFQYGIPYLIPALRADGLTLAQAGLLVACPIAGLLLTLLAWGVAADRWVSAPSSPAAWRWAARHCWRG